MKYLYRILFFNYFHSIFGFYLGFIGPTLFAITLIGFRFTNVVTIPSFMALVIIRNATTNLAVSLTQLRLSGFFSHLATTPFAKPRLKFKFFAVIIIFNGALSVFIALWILLLSVIMQPNANIFTNVNWGYTILGFILLLIMSLLLGLLIGGLARSNGVSRIIGLYLYFLSTYLLGIVYGYNLINKYAPAINIITLFIPFDYSVSIIQVGWSGNVHNMTIPYFDHITNTTVNYTVGLSAMWIAILVSIIIIILSAIGFWQTFKYYQK